MLVLNFISSIYFILTLQLNIIVNITVVIYYVSVKMLLNRWPGILCLTMGSLQDNRNTWSTMRKKKNFIQKGASEILHNQKHYDEMML